MEVARLPPSYRRTNASAVGTSGEIHYENVCPVTCTLTRPVLKVSKVNAMSVSTIRRSNEFRPKAGCAMSEKASKDQFQRILLTIVGGLYLYLAIWCTVRPESTSKLVGFDLQPGSGQSEFLTVYGGLEFGMALFFLLPLIRPASTRDSLLCCLLIHAGLVAFRSAGFLLYSDIQPMTWKLAVGEWVIFLLSLCVFVMPLRAKTSDV